MRIIFKLILILCVLLSATTATATATYTVSVPNTNPEMIHVRGAFTLESNLIGMYITRSPQLDDGQAAFVKNLVVRSADGGVIEHKYAGMGDWKLPEGVGAGERVEIEYDIALDHGKYEWGPGIDEVAYKQSDGLFFTGFSLFIFPGMNDRGAVRVRFELPDTWRASTPWTPVSDTNGEFQAANMMALGRNCLFIGAHLEETVSIEGFEFLLAIGGDLKAKKQLFVDAMTPLLPAYVEMFGGMPSASRYLVVINHGNRSDGGAFPGSYSMLIKGDVNQASSVVWGHGIAHELLHFWNGHTIKPESVQDEEWFKEGFTDYLTIVALSRSGLDTREVTFRKLENMARRYIVAKLLMESTDSMRAAGAQKHRNRFLVYGGGALIAFALDVRIRLATENRRGLDDVMKKMYEEFSSGRKYSFADILRVTKAVSGQDQSEFFEKYVDGTEMLDIGPSFREIGLQLTTMMDEFYLSDRDGATRLERARASGIFGANFVN